ncbi:MAG: hypothetical protein QM729_11240 [Solirubrobacterales bacterium]
MAGGNNEHRMVFDIRGRRRHVVKVVYAILAILMAASLFLVTGAININSIFGNSSSGESAVSAFEKEAERIEAKLKKEPGEEKLLANLTRARINTANAMISAGVESEGEVEEVKQQLAQVSEDWSEYVKATGGEPSAGIAIQAAPALFQLAEISSSSEEALENVKAATEAQEIVAEQRPSLNSLSTLAFYQLFTQNYKAANEALRKAKGYAGTKFERESLENKYEEVKKNAKEFGKDLKAEKATKSSSAGKESLESPLQGIGGSSLSGE